MMDFIFHQGSIQTFHVKYFIYQGPNSNINTEKMVYNKTNNSQHKNTVRVQKSLVQF